MWPNEHYVPILAGSSKVYLQKYPAQSMITIEMLLMTNVCLHFVSNGPGVKFIKFVTLLLAVSYACCMVDTISFVCFPIITEIAGFFPSETAGKKL